VPGSSHAAALINSGERAGTGITWFWVEAVFINSSLQVLAIEHADAGAARTPEALFEEIRPGFRP
jgi:hypothetical protein